MTHHLPMPPGDRENALEHRAYLATADARVTGWVLGRLHLNVRGDRALESPDWETRMTDGWGLAVLAVTEDLPTVADWPRVSSQKQPLEADQQNAWAGAFQVHWVQALQLQELY